jgi:hypothetical protein
VVTVPDLQPVFDDLRRRLSVHEDAFVATANLTDANAGGGRKVDEPSSGAYVLLGAPTARYPDGQYFAGVKLGKRYVSYYLMSVYAEPAMLEQVSDRLRGRMQGKSCFNFTRVDEELFAELADLTRRGREHFEREGLLAR